MLNQLKRILVYCLLLGSSGLASATPPFVIEPLNNAKNSANAILANVGGLTEVQREALRSQLTTLRSQLQALKSNIYSYSPRSVQSGWNIVYAEFCPAFCQSVGLSIGTSAEGSQCISGEVRPESALGIVTFPHGCWRNCEGHPAIDGRSDHHACYHTGQRKDWDYTDVTVGCFCQ